MKRLWTWLAANSAQLQALSSIVIIVGLTLGYTQVKLIYSQSQATTMLDITRIEDELFQRSGTTTSCGKFWSRELPATTRRE